MNLKQKSKDPRSKKGITKKKQESKKGIQKIQSEVIYNSEALVILNLVLLFPVLLFICSSVLGSSVLILLQNKKPPNRGLNAIP